MKKTIIVMPVANEGATMNSIIEEIMALPYDNLYLYPVIDSYSKDDTESIIHSWEAKTDKVKCIFYEQSTGVISCYFEGFRQALKDGAEQILEMDGGGSHKPAEIPQFLNKMDEGYECVWGSRFMPGGSMHEQPLYRRILSSGGTLLANLVLGTNLKDMTSGFECFKREILESLILDNFMSTGHMYQTEMRFYCRNLKTVEVPIHYVGTASSLKFKSITEALKLLFVLAQNERFVH